METSQTSRIPREYLIPGAIIIAGIIIAGSVVGSAKVYLSKAAVAQLASENQPSVEKINAVTAKDHVYGDAKAPLTFVMYSDTECPFCKSFHQDTVEPLLVEFGDAGKVRFVYRYFPLISIHPKAVREAVALECAAKFGGNSKFWSYLKEIFAVTPSNNKLDSAELPKIASRLGLDTKAFTPCLDDEKMVEKVKVDYEDALATGGEGTPWSILITKKGNKIPVNGALPYDQLKKLFEDELAKK